RAGRRRRACPRGGRAARLGRRAGVDGIPRAERLRAGRQGRRRWRGAPRLVVPLSGRSPGARERPPDPPGGGIRGGRDSGGLDGTFVEVVVVVTVGVGVLRPLLDVVLHAGAARELALERGEVRVGAEVLQLPSDFGVLCLLTAAPHA